MAMADSADPGRLCDDDRLWSDPSGDIYSVDLIRTGDDRSW